MQFSFIFFLYFSSVWLVFSFHGMLCVLFSWNGQGHHTRTDGHHVSHDRHLCHFPNWGRCHICHCSLPHHWLCTAIIRPSELRYCTFIRASHMWRALSISIVSFLEKAGLLHIYFQKKFHLLCNSFIDLPLYIYGTWIYNVHVYLP